MGHMLTFMWITLVVWRAMALASEDRKNSIPLASTPPSPPVGDPGLMVVSLSSSSALFTIALSVYWTMDPLGCFSAKNDLCEVLVDS